MTRGRDLLPLKVSEALEIPNRHPASRYADFKHLIEVAIVERSVPSDTHQRAAHQAGHSFGIEVAGQQCHVVGVFPAPMQEFSEALDRHVRESEQPMKLDGELL